MKHQSEQNFLLFHALKCFNDIILNVPYLWLPSAVKDNLGCDSELIFSGMTVLKSLH